MSSKGHTELQISLSRAKNGEEAAGDIRFCVFPQKMSEKAEQINFFDKIFRNFPKVSERIRTHPDASECIRRHPNGSEQVRTGPSKPENLENLTKTMKNSRKFCENFREGSFPFHFNLHLNQLRTIWQ